MIRRRLWWMLITLAAVAGSSPAQLWEWVSPRPQGNDLSAVAFFDEAEGWAAGAGAVLLHTADGGLSWALIDLAAPYEWTQIAFPDAERGWVAGSYYGADSLYFAVWQTTDGGLTWHPQLAGSGFVPEGLAFPTAQRGLAIGYQLDSAFAAIPVLYRTTDSGATWQEQRFALPGGLVAVDFVTPEAGFLGTAAGHLLATTDGGETWAVREASVPAEVQDLDFIDSEQGWAVSWSAIWATTDGGFSWSLQESTATDLRAVAFASAQTGYAVSPTNGLWRTTDGGARWEAAATDPAWRLAALATQGPERVWAVGRGGALAQSTDGGASWTDARAGLTAPVYAVSFITSEEGWVGGAAGALYHTTDGGVLWQAQPLPPEIDARQLTFSDARHGWGVGGANCFYTQDGGESWQVLPADSETRYHDIQFTDSLTGFRALSWRDERHGWETHSIEATSDGGQTWQVPYYQTSEGLLGEIDFADPRHGYVVDFHNRVILRTADGGELWSVRQPPSGVRMQDIAAVDSLTVWLLTGSGLFQSTTGGLTWVLRDTAGTGRFIDFAGPLHGCICGGEVLRRTTDGGATWDSAPALLISGLQDLTVTASGAAWLIGYYGGIVHHPGAAPASVPPPWAALPQNPALGAYPNPFNPVARIVCDLPRAGQAELRIYDLLGRTVRTLVDSRLPGGRHEFTFNGSGLASGIYFARLSVDGQAVTRKLVLMK